MSYATIEDAKAQLGEDALLLVADRDGDGVIDTEMVAAAIEDAGALIDTHVSARYALPLAAVPPVLRSAAIDIAHYRLANRPGQMTDDIRRRYEDAISLLKRVADGKADLPGLARVSGDDGATPAGGGAVFVPGGGTMFGRHAHRGGRD